MIRIYIERTARVFFEQSKMKNFVHSFYLVKRLTRERYFYYSIFIIPKHNFYPSLGKVKNQYTEVMTWFVWKLGRRFTWRERIFADVISHPTRAPYWPIGLKNYRCSPMHRCFNITSPIRRALPIHPILLPFRHSSTIRHKCHDYTKVDRNLFRR